MVILVANNQGERCLPCLPSTDDDLKRILPRTWVSWSWVEQNYKTNNKLVDWRCAGKHHHWDLQASPVLAQSHFFIVDIPGMKCLLSHRFPVCPIFLLQIIAEFMFLRVFSCLRWCPLLLQYFRLEGPGPQGSCLSGGWSGSQQVFLANAWKFV